MGWDSSDNKAAGWKGARQSGFGFRHWQNFSLR